jgi:hypothetical protein
MMLACMLLGACAGPAPMSEAKPPPPEPMHRRNFVEDVDRVCQASRAVLLGDGYVVQRQGNDGFIAARETPVKNDSKEDGYAHFRVYVTCIAQTRGSALFVTATNEHFGVKALRDSTLIGLPLISPISVGSRTEGQQQVKLTGETVEQREFYDRFFQAVRAELAAVRPEAH